MRFRKASRAGAWVAAGVIATGALGLAVRVSPAYGAVQAALASPVKVNARRLTETQYRHIAADLFGAQTKINARFEPERREDGLLAIGSNRLSITAGGFEQYFSLARGIADQVLSPERRDATVNCKPADAGKPDDACATTFIRHYGDQLFRRPMTDTEVAARVKLARTGAAAGDFYDGLKLSLVSLMVSPEFLFRVEQAEPDPASPGKLRLDGYTKASRLSFLLWDGAPDAELLAAAKSGALHTEEGLKRQVARLTASPRLQDGARAFFTDMLQMDAFEGLNKDAADYPKFSQAVADSAREQTLRTMVDLLVVKNRDYREIFTANETFMNRPLASVYQVPFTSKAEWTPYTFAPDSGRSGVITQVSFLSLFSHPGRSSPTQRGVKLYEIFMCSPTPDPPADVDFSKVQDSHAGTVRGRLLEHMTNEGCAQCHKVSDPAGLALEHFDSLGQLRTQENGALIDVRGEIGGVKFNGAQELGHVLQKDPKVAACLVRNAYYYGVGRTVDERDEDYLAAQTKTFAASGYRVPALFTQIALSPQFMKVVKPAGVQPPTPPVRVAATTTAPQGEAR